MVKEVTGAVIGSVITGILGFLALSSMGLLEKSITDTQVRQLASAIVNDEANRAVLIEEVNERNQAKMLKLQSSLDQLQVALSDTSEWPHAINCGSLWDALFILHGNPIDGNGLAWYVQVYPNEYRYVRFDANGSFHDKQGDNNSSVGCANKSISQLRRENRTYQFIQK